MIGIQGEINTLGLFKFLTNVCLLYSLSMTLEHNFIHLLQKLKKKKQMLLNSLGTGVFVLIH